MTAHVSQSNFGSSLLYEDRLPINVEIYSATPAPGELLRVGLLNDEVLRSIMSLDEVISSSDKNEDADRHNELQRLEIKVNLMLDMIGEIYAQSIKFPDPTPIKLGATQLYWLLGSDEARIEAGTYVGVQVYLTRRYPRPLVLIGQVQQLAPSEAGEIWVALQLLAMPQHAQDSLERFVFRQHRRFVAFSRRK